VIKLDWIAQRASHGFGGAFRLFGRSVAEGSTRFGKVGMSPRSIEESTYFANRIEQPRSFQ
jgi:hypothetical protein